MTREEMHKAVGKLLYIEDYNMIDIVLATMVANKLKLGDPVWLLLIGASSGGKSQLLRPIALADADATVRVDDLTENTFISGFKTDETSLLLRLGVHGTIMISDLTVIFSKGVESRNAILGQLRMVFDGEFTKHFGNQKPVTWKGHAGMIAGATPSAYRHFAQVADMGERFVYYRMKEPDYTKASEFIINNPRSAHTLDDELKDIYLEYLQGVLRSADCNFELLSNTKKIIRDISLCGTKFRTPVHIDERSRHVDEIPVKEAPYRVMKQLTSIAKALHIMHKHDTGKDELPPDMQQILKWCAYSLASDKRRLVYSAVLNLNNKTLRNVSSYTGLYNDIVERDLAELTSIGVLKLQEKVQGKENAYKWNSVDYELEVLVRELNPYAKTIDEETEEETKEEW